MHFLHKAHHSLLALTNTRQHFSTTLGAILNTEITHTKHQNVKDVALNRLKRIFVYKVKTKRQSVAYFDLCWECVCQVTQILHCFARI